MAIHRLPPQDRWPRWLGRAQERLAGWGEALQEWLQVARRPRVPLAPLAPDAPGAHSLPLPTPTPSPIYTHVAHPHTPRNVNAVHAAEHADGGFNIRLAVWLTKHTGTMACAYLFAGIGLGSLIGVLTGNVLLAAVFGSLSSYFLQLVFLPVLQVGSNVLNRHAELQSDEMFATTQRTYHDIRQAQEHLTAQDHRILALEAVNARQLALLTTHGAQLVALLAAVGASTAASNGAAEAPVAASSPAPPAATRRLRPSRATRSAPAAS